MRKKAKIGHLGSRCPHGGQISKGGSGILGNGIMGSGVMGSGIMRCSIMRSGIIGSHAVPMCDGILGRGMIPHRGIRATVVCVFRLSRALERCMSNTWQNAEASLCKAACRSRMSGSVRAMETTTTRKR